MTVFQSLKVRNYRLFASGQVVSLSGTWMQRVAQDWLVLNLSHNSGTAIGITTGLQFAPVLLFGMYGGVIADRYNKRRVLIITQIVMGLLALALGLLDLSGAVALWHVYALAFGLGIASAIDAPVRQAFVTELVGPSLLANAVGLNSATFNAARVLGPAVAGVLIAATGTSWVFLINAVSFLAVISCLVSMRESELFVGKRAARRKGAVREGLAYVRRRPELVAIIALVGVVGMLGFNFQITSALLTKNTFHHGAGSYGLISAVYASGSLLGALASARRGQVGRRRLVFLAAAAYGAIEVLAGLTPTYWTFFALLVPFGFATMTFSTAANTTVQLGATPSMRGRVMALYIMIFLGGTPIGAPLIGWIAEVAGPRWSLITGGIASMAAAVVAALYLARRERLRVEPHLLRRRPHVHVRPTQPVQEEALVN
ncbi:MAG TPA: MFS transporter [Mycobacteriales bacterium]|nr:MFS transporter [Mycobacteriales bacterium]